MVIRQKKLDKQIAKKLFGGDHEISISRLEKYAACAYAHFLTYGLQLKDAASLSLEQLTTEAFFMLQSVISLSFLKNAI